jgi:putative transposase
VPRRKASCAGISAGSSLPGAEFMVRHGSTLVDIYVDRREGRRHSRRRVEQLMREIGLAAHRGRRRTPRTTDSRHNLPIAPNLLGRDFVAERPDTVWLADISYIPTSEGFLYLAAVEDMATRQIVGWAMADHLRAELCTDALVMALQQCRPARGLVHHSDRGVQLGFKWSSQHHG